MHAYRVQATNLTTPATNISLYVPLGDAATTWEAITKVFYPGGVPANNLPFGPYRVTVFIDSMNRHETSIYRFN